MPSIAIIIVPMRPSRALMIEWTTTGGCLPAEQFD